VKIEPLRQQIPENLSDDGRHVRIYGTTYYGRRYLNGRKKLSKGEIEYLAWLKAQPSRLGRDWTVKEATPDV